MHDCVAGEGVEDLSQEARRPVSSWAYVGLGANLGDRLTTIEQALSELESLDSVELRGVSKLRETDPVGRVDQPRFLNGACQLETTIAPRTLLDALLAIETGLGRIRGERWGPRTIDLDLLLFGTQVIDEPGLVVPHPRLAERAFVLEPLLDLEPDLTLPDGRSVKELFLATKMRPDVAAR